MNADLLLELNKKDDDLQVLEGEGGHEMLIITSIPEFDELMLEEVEEEQNMLVDEAQGPRMDIWVKVTRVIFMVNTMVSALVLTGFIPYQFLLNDERIYIRYVLLGIWITICLTLYVCMAIWRRARLASTLFVFWAISYYALVIDIAAIIEDFAPLQFALVTFAQSLYVIVYTIYSPSYVDAWKSFYIMLIMGLLAWAMGLYAFIEQQDWVPATLLLIASVLSAAYSAVEIHYVTRYSVSWEDCVEAVIRFYTDPIIWMWEWVQRKRDK